MLQSLRADGMDVPVLFLSALGELEDRVSGLRAGAMLHKALFALIEEIRHAGSDR